MKHVPVPLTRVSGQRKPKCQMNDRAGAQGRKTKPPPVVRLAEQRPGEGRALTWSSAPAAAGCGWGWGRRAARRPGRCPDPRPQRPPAGPRAPREKQAAAGAAARRMQLSAAAAAATGPKDPARPSPTRQPEAGTRDAARSRARPVRPSVALPAALRSGLGLGLPLCWHPPSLPTTPRAPRAAPRHRPPPGYAAPLARPADSVESAAAGTREAMSSARAREGTRGSGHPREVHRRAPRPGRGASPSGPAAPGSPPLALQASPASRAPARPRGPLSPLPAGSPSLPRAATFLGPCVPGALPCPGALALGGEGCGPLTSGGAGAPPARRLGDMCPHLPAGRWAGGFLHVVDQREGSGRGEGRGRERLQTLSSWTFPGKMRESGAGAARRKTNPEAAAEPELLSFCDAEGHEGSERRSRGRRRPSDIRQAGLFRNAPGRLNAGVSCLDFPNRKGKTVILMSPTRGVVTIKNGLMKALPATLSKEGTQIKNNRIDTLSFLFTFFAASSLTQSHLEERVKMRKC